MSEAERTRDRMERLHAELDELLAQLGRSGTFLKQADYALRNDLPCPRCRKPFTKWDYDEGVHPCVAITRGEQNDDLRRLSDIRTELFALNETLRQIEDGEVFVDPIRIQKLINGLAQDQTVMVADLLHAAHWHPGRKG